MDGRKNAAIGGIFSEEKVMVCILLALGAVFTFRAMVLNFRQERIASIVFNLISVCLLIWAVGVTSIAWR